MIGYLSILVGFAVLVFLIYKNWNMWVVSLIATFIVIAMNLMDPGTTLSEIYWPQFASVFNTLFPMIFLGCVLAYVYNCSGAANVLADRICGAIFNENSSSRQKTWRGIAAVIAVAIVLTYGGINSAVTLITVYPVALRIFEKANIPKKLIMGAITGGAFTFPLVGAGSPQPPNVLLANMLGTTPNAGLCGSLVASVVEVAFIILMLTRMALKANVAGVNFAYGPNDSYVAESSDESRPGFLAAIIPMIVLIVLYNVVKLHILLSLLVAFILALILFRNHIEKDDWKNAFEDGAKTAFLPTGTIGAVLGFAAVVQSLPEFQAVLDHVFAMKASPFWILLLSIMCCALLTGSSTTAVLVAIPMVKEQLLAKGLSTVFIHRVGLFSATIVDSVPYSGAVLMSLKIADLSVKDGYPAIFLSTCAATALGTFVCAGFMTLFPMLP